MHQQQSNALRKLEIVTASHVESKVGTRRDVLVGHADTAACDHPPAEFDVWWSTNR